MKRSKLWWAMAVVSAAWSVFSTVALISAIQRAERYKADAESSWIMLLRCERDRCIDRSDHTMAAP